MTDRDRSRWCWDRVWIGCGKSKAPTRSTAGEMYTGSLFASHRAIIDHLGLSLFEPEILSAKHGVIPWTTTIDPYEAELDADARKRLDFAALVEAERLIDEALRGRGRLADPDQQSWSRVGSAFGPPLQPAIPHRPPVRPARTPMTASITPELLKVTLMDHLKWLRGEQGGKRAVLTGADLTNARPSGPRTLMSSPVRGCWSRRTHRLCPA